MAGWVCVASFAYAGIIEPIVRMAAMLGGYAGAFPAIDNGLMLDVLFALLGISALRTHEKTKGLDK